MPISEGINAGLQISTALTGPFLDFILSLGGVFLFLWIALQAIPKNKKKGYTFGSMEGRI